MKILKTALTSLILLFFISSCTWVGTKKNIRIFDERTKVNTQDSFYLIYPKNGFYNAMFTTKLKENHKSSKEVVGIFRAKLFEEVGEISISDKNISLEEGFKAAKLKGSKYLIDININEWKDAFYAMCTPSQTGNNPNTDPVTLDTVDLTVFVYNVQTKTLINKQKIKNKGCPIVLAGVIPIGKNSPNSRLESMIPAWLNNLRM
ncbi:MAG: hypothetical protein ACJAW3_001004 [Lentimonas sp.]|jgi:hypothetical protein